MRSFSNPFSSSFLLCWNLATSPLLALETLLSVASFVQLASKCFLDLSFSFGIRVEYQISSDDAFGLTITLSAAIKYMRN